MEVCPVIEEISELCNGSIGQDLGMTLSCLFLYLVISFDCIGGMLMLCITKEYIFGKRLLISDDFVTIMREIMISYEVFNLPIAHQPPLVLIVSKLFEL